MRKFSGDGLIQHEELQHVMRACMDENGMKFSETQVSYVFPHDKTLVLLDFFLSLSQIDDLTRAMFDDADPDNRLAMNCKFFFLTFRL